MIENWYNLAHGLLTRHSNLINSTVINVDIVFESVQKHCEKYPTSVVFLYCIVGVLILNIIRAFLIWLEKKRGMPNQPCKFLSTEGNQQDCNHPSYRNRFKKNGGDCEKCWGKTSPMTDSEAETRILSGNVLKRCIVRIANWSRTILPYASFVYTLILTALENK